jgi:hypothetical protein
MWNSLHRSKLLSLKEERELEDDGQEGEKVRRVKVRRLACLRASDLLIF